MESTDTDRDKPTKKYALTILIIALTLVTLILILIYALVPREEQSMHARPEIPQEEPPAQMQAHPETAQTKQVEKAENPNRIITQAQEAQAEIKEVQTENPSNTQPQEPPAQPESPNNTHPQEAQPNNTHTGTRPHTPLLQECIAHYEEKIAQLEEEIEVLKEKARKQGRAYALLMDNMQENVVDIARLRVDMTGSNNEIRSHVQYHDETIKELKKQVFKINYKLFKTSGASLNPQPKPLSVFNGNLEEEEQPDLVF
ncbi:hypothetical protein NEIRO02_2653 [Nematocida sp. AWRm79]|nr:hypothetical protein NEIRO02_2653 [Nematocida sp. AWRm79]